MCLDAFGVGGEPLDDQEADARPTARDEGNTAMEIKKIVEVRKSVSRDTEMD